MVIIIPGGTSKIWHKKPNQGDSTLRWSCWPIDTTDKNEHSSTNWCNLNEWWFCWSISHSTPTFSAQIGIVFKIEPPSFPTAMLLKSVEASHVEGTEIDIWSNKFQLGSWNLPSRGSHSSHMAPVGVVLRSRHRPFSSRSAVSAMAFSRA